MTKINGIYFHDEECSIGYILKELFKKKKIRKIDIIEIIKGW